MLERLLFPPVWFSEARLRAALAGKTIVLTGASFGIGEAALGPLIAAKPARIILVARTEEKLKALQAQYAQSGVMLEYRVCDLSQEAEVEALAEDLAHLERLDLLIHNAGKSIRRSVYEALDRYHDYQRTMQLNYFAPLRLTLALLPLLERSGGQIILNSAANVRLPPPAYWSAYQASKVAFEQALRCMAPEARARGVVCSILYLPLVRTRMIAPTAVYRSAPAMSPNQAALRLLKLAYTHQAYAGPWWLGGLSLVGFILRPLFELWQNWQVKRAKRR